MRVVVQEYERVVLFRAGVPGRVLGPGRHRVRRRGSSQRRIDVRDALLKVAGQEVLTADGVGIKLSVVVRYRVEDPRAWIAAAAEDETGAARLYLAAQLSVRDAVGALAAVDVPAGRAQVAQVVEDAVRAVAGDVGAVVLQVAVRDVTLPGDLKRVFAQVAAARQEALAALERARGETATLRSLANAAKLLDGNPGLAQLRAITAVERGGGTVVLGGDPPRM